MLDIKEIRTDPERFRQGMINRGLFPEVIDELLEIDKQLRAAKTAAQEAQSRFNKLNKMIALQKQMEKLEAEIAEINVELAKLEETIHRYDDQIEALFAPIADLLPKLP